MNSINLKYFKSSLEASVFEYHNNGETCFFCNDANVPIVELDGSLEIIAKKLGEQPEYVCIKCLQTRIYAFEQEV